MQKRIKRKIWTIYRKNKDDVKAIFQGIYPPFVYRQIESIPKGLIPIFGYGFGDDMIKRYPFIIS